MKKTFGPFLKRTTDAMVYTPLPGSGTMGFMEDLKGKRREKDYYIFFNVSFLAINAMIEKLTLTELPR